MIAITSFAGIAPLVAPEQLPDNAALAAVNCKVSSGALVPVKASVSAGAVIKTATKALYRHKGDWLSWQYDTDIATCPVARDAFGRIYFTTPIGGPEGGKAQVLNYYTDLVGTKNTAFLGAGAPTGSYHLGMPAPVTAPTLGTPTGGDATNPEAVRYVYTYVSRFGEESSQSPSTLLSARDLGATVPVTWSVPGSDYTGRVPVDYVNIYRSNTGSTSTQYQFVAQVAIGTGSYSDAVPNSSLDGVLATENWLPPVTGIMGLVNLPNGSLAGFRDNTLYFSEPFFPHAWLQQYLISFAYDIVAIAAAGMSLLVVTTGPTFVVTGNTPGAMVYEQMDLSFSCINKRSIVDIGSAIIYAAPVGLVAFSAGGSQVVTLKLIGKTEWDAFYPSTMLGFQFAGSFLGFYDNGAGAVGALAMSSDGNITTHDSSFAVTAGWYDQVDGELYLVVGNTVVQYDVGPAVLTFTWRSKTFILPSPTNFSIAQVRADAYPVTFRLYDYSTGSAVLKHSATVADSKPFRLPSGFMMDKCAVEVSGDKRITQVLMAQSVAELGGI